MTYDWLIIDGYSLLHREARLKEYISGGRLELGRGHLLRLVEESAFSLAERVTLVFDGRSGRAGQDVTSSLVEVLFSPDNQTADTVIERLVCSAPKPETICVVSNDRTELNVVTGRGAHGMSCGQFLDLRQAEMRRPSAPSRKGSSFSLGDLFPE